MLVKKLSKHKIYQIVLFIILTVSIYFRIFIVARHTQAFNTLVDKINISSNALIILMALYNMIVILGTALVDSLLFGIILKSESSVQVGNLKSRIYEYFMTYFMIYNVILIFIYEALGVYNSNTILVNVIQLACYLFISLAIFDYSRKQLNWNIKRLITANVSIFVLNTIVILVQIFKQVFHS